MKVEKKKRKGWAAFLEELALTALHAYPTLYARRLAHRPDSSTAVLWASYRDELKDRLAQMPAWERWFVIGAYPILTLVTAIYQTARCGRRVARSSGRSIAAQFADQMALAFREGMPARFYYLFELHKPENRAAASSYIQRAHLKRGGLYGRLYRANRDRDLGARILNNKWALDSLLREHGLPSTRLIGEAQDGVFTLTNAAGNSLPPVDIFAKPGRANGGMGAERWLFTEGAYRDGSGTTLTAEELAQHFASLSRRIPYLVQECLINHRELRDLSAGALSTLRMYTFWNERSEVEHVFTMLRMSRDPRSAVDNVCKGGLAAAVDPVTGTLGRATDGALLAETGWVDRHPVTGGQITGRAVPFWNEAVKLARTAHQLIWSPFLVGWDIAVTPSGPVIIEGNKQPDIEVEQRLSGPWGDQRFGQLLAFHLCQTAVGAAALIGKAVS